MYLSYNFVMNRIIGIYRNWIVYFMMIIQFKYLKGIVVICNNQISFIIIQLFCFTYFGEHFVDFSVVAEQ